MHACLRVRASVRIRSVPRKVEKQDSHRWHVSVLVDTAPGSDAPASSLAASLPATLRAFTNGATSGFSQPLRAPPAPAAATLSSFSLDVGSTEPESEPEAECAVAAAAAARVLLRVSIAPDEAGLALAPAVASSFAAVVALEGASDARAGSSPLELGGAGAASVACTSSIRKLHLVASFDRS